MFVATEPIGGRDWGVKSKVAHSSVDHCRNGSLRYCPAQWARVRLLVLMWRERLAAAVVAGVNRGGPSTPRSLGGGAGGR